MQLKDHIFQKLSLSWFKDCFLIYFHTIIPRSSLCGHFKDMFAFQEGKTLFQIEI